ncbi:adenylyl-sulfate kinase [Paenibacillus harenae]|uniref:Adenylyl-sulfate kinase n=1 Tax=Paenibacillus harenae TaxID=306543 RepID=A0ABT9U955_PAEHA|nr:adenylyl-sulfate kinase [Paenibacillus harenae]MDQ0115225.1 adenylylsulfate kinase [Paenibacillus harenae]
MENVKNVVHQGYHVTKEMRQQSNKHGSFVIWLTGLSGSGKSTIANALDHFFYNNDYHAFVLDGDNVRLGLNKNLGFSPDDRKENIRRVGEVSKLFVEAGSIVMAAFISPYIQDRQEVRSLFQQGEFIEVYIKCSLEQCEQRDPKGLYKKARKGELPDFTGITSPYEISTSPEIIIETDQLTVEESVDKIINYIKANQLI